MGFKNRGSDTLPGAYPAGATPITASSGNVAAATAAATLAGAAGLLPTLPALKSPGQAQLVQLSLP